jgi:murein DD-endopeptidase MepM/ murein hydrolase activator NlpD
VFSSAGKKWRPWSTYNNGSYKAHLTEAQHAADAIAENPGSAEGLTTSQKNKATKSAILGTAEDTWTCLKRIFAEVNWRCYVDNGAVYVGPDSAFLTAPIEVKISEDSEGVDSIDYDFDLGKATATATVQVRAHRWQLPPGTAVQLDEIGLPNPWIVASVDRDLFSTTATVTLKKPEPELPEPDPPDDPGSVDAGYFGDSSGFLSGSDIAGGGNGIYIWPINGAHMITSPFGQRTRNFHSGIDIACPDGTPVYAARQGVVSFAGSQSGYGNVVYIGHRPSGKDDAVGPYPLDEETRYGHLSRIAVRRGLQVEKGQLIGESGHSGDATGPHLHFEIRVKGTAIDPMTFLGGRPKGSLPRATTSPSSGG